MASANTPGLSRAETLDAVARSGDLGAAGQAVTATAVVGAFAALLTPVVSSRWDRRYVMLGLLVLLGLSIFALSLGALGTLFIDRYRRLAEYFVLGGPGG